MIAPVKNIAPSEIRMPSSYVRAKGLDEAWAKELAVIATQSAEWPFEPIEVFPVKDDKKGRKWEVNNGAHRLWVAVKTHQKSIPCRVLTYSTPGEAYAAQLVSTMKSGALKLDLDSRDSAIRQLVLHFKMDRKAVMQLTGLSDASISRILAEKQRTGETGKRKGKKKKARKASKSGAGNGNAFAPLDWYGGLVALLDSYTQHADAIVRARVEVDPQILASAYSMISSVVTGEMRKPSDVAAAVASDNGA